MSLLEVNNLRTSFFTDKGEIKAVNGINFSLCKGETLGLVGESGCGKTVTALSIMRLIPRSARILAGSIIYKDKNLLELNDKEMRSVCGKEISMVFQEPMTSLNPVFTIGEQIAETIELHKNIKSKEAKNRAVELLQRVGISEAQKRINAYPHTLSGGIRQRVLIAMALASNPSLLIADEPTTALDVTIQAQILELLDKLKKEKDIGLILITHDLGVVAEHVDRVAIMYAGKILEYALTPDLFKEPLHPYTKALLDSLPNIESKGKKLNTLAGAVPSLSQLPKECLFYERCSIRSGNCRNEQPELTELKPGHWVACSRAGDNTN